DRAVHEALLLHRALARELGARHDDLEVAAGSAHACLGPPERLLDRGLHIVRRVRHAAGRITGATVHSSTRSPSASRRSIHTRWLSRSESVGPLSSASTSPPSTRAGTAPGIRTSGPGRIARSGSPLRTSW